MSPNPSLQRVLRATPGLFLLLQPDDEFTIVGASTDYLKMSRTDESIFGRPLFDVFPDNPAVDGSVGSRSLRASLERVIASGQPDRIEALRYDVRHPASEGGGFEERYWSPLNTPVLADDGSVELIVHTVEEATADANLKAVELLESIAEGFFTLDRQWRFNFVNSEAHRILGVMPGELSKRVIWDVYPGLQETPFGEGYRHTMITRTKASFTAFYAGQGRWYEVTSFPSPEGISVYFRDITDRKRLEAEREELAFESERQRRIYEAALDATLDFFYVFGTDHRAIYANASLRTMWGVDDVRGKHWTELGYEQWHADLHDRELDQVIATRAPLRGVIPFAGTNGRRTYEYIFAPVLDAAGDVVAVAGTTRDITDREAGEIALREQAERLAEADRVKDEFLATLAHELRNPLAPLRNAVELLRGPLARDDRERRIHAMMERQVLHLVRLVDDLLELSRISRGAVTLQRCSVRLADAIQQAVETCESAIDQAGHALEVELPAYSVVVDADPARLTQILTNLLTNAVSYTNAGGRIGIEARSEDDQAVVRVIDDGIGIAPEALPRLFEMFNRGDRHSARNQGGLGIGLALSRRLAQLHGGSLDAASGGVGHGSEFTLRLPLATASSVAAKSSSGRGFDINGLRILVIDDNRDAADSLALVLSARGAVVDVAYGGADGLAAFAARPATAVVLDIGMPGMSGYEVARALRGHPKNRAPLLIALTGWDQPADRQLAEAAGFDRHFAKPADVALLVQVLATRA